MGLLVFHGGLCKHPRVKDAWINPTDLGGYTYIAMTFNIGLVSQSPSRVYHKNVSNEILISMG